MALIDIIPKTKKFTRVKLDSLPPLLLNQIIELAIFTGITLFEVWEEEILETYVYDGGMKKQPVKFYIDNTTWMLKQKLFLLLVFKIITKVLENLVKMNWRK